MTGKAIGIDLGNTYSCVGIGKSKQVEILPNAQGNRTTPSYVGFTDTERLIGEEAKRQAPINPHNTVFDAKRLIGRKFDHPDLQSDMKHWPFKVESDGGRPLVEVQYKGESKKFSAEEISSMVLLKMKETAEAYLGRAVTGAVVAVPAYYNDSQRQAIKDAAKIIGLKVLSLINEPTAAAMNFGWTSMRRDDKEQNVMVCDLGASGIQVSILKMGNHQFDVLSTSCESHVAKDFWDQIETENFSQTIKTTVQLAMENSGLEAAQVDHIVLVGGSSRIQKVREIIAGYFDKGIEELNTSLNPDEAVAHGAALLASILASGEEMERPRDVSAFRLSTETAGDEMTNTSLIERNARIPMGVESKIERQFKTVQAGDTRISVQLYESEGDFTYYAKTLMREYEVSVVAPEPDRSHGRMVKVLFQLGPDGMVTMRAPEDQLAETEVTTTNDGDRLTKEQVERMVNEAEKYKVDEQMRAND